MKNKLTDLNNALFEQLERLNDDSVTGDKLNEEIKRSKSITNVSKQIIDNGRLVLDAEIAKYDYGLKGDATAIASKPSPPALGER